jgi:hypothetical protein
LIVKSSRFPHISYYHHGREVRESAASVIREVEAKKGRPLTAEEAMNVATKFLKRRVREVANERDAIRPFLGPRNERVTVNELLDDLEAEYRLGGKRRIPREVDTSMRSHLKRLRSHFGEMRAMAIGRRQVEEFICLLRNQQKSNATINRSTQLLGQAFRIGASSDPPKVLRPPTIPKLDESANIRKGKSSEPDAEQVFASLPAHLVDLAE